MSLGVPEWISRANDKKLAATAILRNAQLARETWELCGKGVEFALKAYIMRRERLNEWPDRGSRRDLHVHEARRLITLAGISVVDLDADVAASFSKVCEWRREHDYQAHAFPHREAKEMYEAAFGPNGVVTWVEARI